MSISDWHNNYYKYTIIMGETLNPKTGVSNLLILLIPLGILTFITMYVKNNKNIIKNL